MTPGIPYKLVAGLVGALLFVGALTWLIGSRNSWKATAASNEQLYHAEQNAHQQTVTNYRTATAQAKVADAANVARVKAEEATINEQRTTTFEARIAAANEQYRRLQLTANAAASHPGRSGSAPVSGVPQVASGTPSPAAQGELSTDDALVATKQAIQLDELIKAVTALSNINVNGTDALSNH